MNALSIEPIPTVAAIEPYGTRQPAAGVDLFLDRNEGTAPPPLSGLDIAVNRYPSAYELEARLASILGTSDAGVVVTAGADDGLERALRAVCAPGREVILTSPTFAMLGRFTRLAGAAVREIPWWTGEFPVDAVCQSSGAETAAVAVVSPNNPTGSTISRAAFEELARRLPHCLILLDHAYAEFADEDLTQVALEHANTLVFRTFSKAWGCAGLRVGYAAGDPRVVRWLRVVGHPYAVSVPSLAAAQRLLEHQIRPEQQLIDRIRSERIRLQELVQGLGAETLPSQANFVLVRPRDARWTMDGLASLGIAVRSFAEPAELAGWLRITLPGDDAAFARLQHALTAVLAPEAVLFDLDGVVADVSRSYRTAIVATAASYGVAIRTSEIGRAKTGGNVNNDWELTRRLLVEHGVDRPLAEIAARFEAIYQGNESRPGLWTTERPMLNRDQLRRLAATRPLAVVTGRPRSDAERFLAEHGLAECFAVLVTLEDGPAKPDPGPVRLALDRLGTARAWMLGDTPDDMAAARTAGVVPIGVVAPGDDAGAATLALRRAGAARVLNRIDEIADLLP